MCVCVGMWGVAASEITKEKAIKQKLYTQKIDVSRQMGKEDSLALAGDKTKQNTEKQNPGDKPQDSGRVEGDVRAGA